MARRRHPTDERRRQIASAALRLLAREGAAGLTAKNIGRSVGISDGAVFKHYPTKAAIVQAAVERFAALLALPAIPPGSGPLERLETFFITRLAVVFFNAATVAVAIIVVGSAKAPPPDGTAAAARCEQLPADSENCNAIAAFTNLRIFSRLGVPSLDPRHASCVDFAEDALTIPRCE